MAIVGTFLSHDRPPGQHGKTDKFVQCQKLISTENLRNIPVSCLSLSSTSNVQVPCGLLPTNAPKAGVEVWSYVSLRSCVLSPARLCRITGVANIEPEMLTPMAQR